MRSKRFGGLSASVAVGCLAAGFATMAHAALGGTPMTPPAADTAAVVRTLAPSVNASTSTTGATSSTSTASSANYTVRETTLGSGTVIREYLSTAGSVFGIAWQGPVKPDLASLLGTYFSQYTAGVDASHAALGVRAPVAIDSATLVVHSGGHMGAFTGQAWLPQALPSGVTGSDIQ
ncbi:MAG: hypothetical protein GAK40_01183 [Burkholderia plantarii]|nr:MAG: hypothetical protein GAK40_01183 [Burkholderia plantarii]